MFNFLKGKPKAETPLSVEEATGCLYAYLAKITGWKFLKSAKSLKKVVNDLVFEIHFYASKWNLSYAHVEIQCELQMWSKKLGQKSDVHSQVGYYQFQPPDGTWWDISNDSNLLKTKKELEKKIIKYAVDLSNKFESDYLEAIRELLVGKEFDEYHVRLEFLALTLENDAIVEKAKEIYGALDDNLRQQVKDYQGGDRSRAWMINPSNLRYIVDNELMNAKQW